MKFNFLKLIFFSALVIAVFIPRFSQAAKIILQTNHENSTLTERQVDLLLTPNEEGINALGSEIVILAGQAELIDIIDGGSIISAWVEQPKIIDNQLIFSGIIPGGFYGLYVPGKAESQSGLILSFKVKQLDSSEVILGLRKLEAYAADGNNVPIKVEPEKLVVNFSEFDKQTQTNKIIDNTPPSDLELRIIKLPEGPSGWWAAFSATDFGSGIAYYEIQENKTSEPNPEAWRPVDNPTRLIDQTRRSYVFLKAVDRQGNEKIISLGPNPEVRYNLYYLLGGLILLLIVVAYLLNYYGKKKHAHRH